MKRTALQVYLTLMAGLGVMLLVGCSSPPATPTHTSTASPTPDAAISADTSYQETLNVERTQAAASLATSTAMMTATSQSPPLTSTPEAAGEARTGMDELDRIIQMVRDGDTEALRSLVRYVSAECTFADGLGGPPKCKEGETEGKVVEALPILAGEGHFIRKEDIGSWIGIDGTDLYAVYSVSAAAFSDSIYPSGEYAIAFINEARFMITALHIVEGQIVRVDATMGSPPVLRADDVEAYLIAPMAEEQ